MQGQKTQQRMQQEQHCHRRTVNFDHTGLWDSESILIILGSGTLDSGTLGWTDNRINNSMAWTAPEKAHGRARKRRQSKDKRSGMQPAWRKSGTTTTWSLPASWLDPDGFLEHSKLAWAKENTKRTARLRWVLSAVPASWHGQRKIPSLPPDPDGYLGRWVCWWWWLG